MPAIIVVGTQWGDEGKGKVIDLLTERAHHIVRAQGGNNAGHTIIIGDQEFKLHLVPSGILHPHTLCTIGAGTVIDPHVLLTEIEGLQKRGIVTEGRLFLSPAAHLIFPYHILLDKLSEERKGELRIGTTGRGIGPCYADKASRIGIRVGELMKKELFDKVLKGVLRIKNEELDKLYGAPPFDADAMIAEYDLYRERLRSIVAPAEEMIQEALARGENILLEGAQGTFLDTSHGTYPFVTSSSTIASGIAQGAGLGPSHITHTLGVMKAYTTRVGEGPLPSEESDEEGFIDHKAAREYGTTTGRRRRCGWFDALLAKKAVELNGLQSIALTKLDILDPLETVKICVGYEIGGKRAKHFPYLSDELKEAKPLYEELPGWVSSTKEVKGIGDLPANAKRYLKRIEELCKTPISLLSFGPERERTLLLSDPFTPKEPH